MTPSLHYALAYLHGDVFIYRVIRLLQVTSMFRRDRPASQIKKNIYWMMVFMTDECVIICGCWPQTHMSTVSRTYHIWKPTNLIKFLFIRSLLIIGV